MGRVNIELRDSKKRLKEKRTEYNYITIDCFTALISALNGNAPSVGPSWGFGFISSNISSGSVESGYCIVPMNGVNYYEYAQGNSIGDSTGSGSNRPKFTFNPAYEGEIDNSDVIIYTVPTPSTMIPITIGTLLGMFLTNSLTPQDASSIFYSIIPFKTPMINVVSGDNIYFNYSFSLIDGGP